MTQQELEDRLVDFSILIIQIVNDLPATEAGRPLAGQLIRSGTSLNYGEARGAESKKDFVHKNQIVLKELRETLISLKIIDRCKLSKQEITVIKALKEVNELISIFVKTIFTATNKAR